VRRRRRSASASRSFFLPCVPTLRSFYSFPSPSSSGFYRFAVSSCNDVLRVRLPVRLFRRREAGERRRLRRLFFSTPFNNLFRRFTTIVFRPVGEQQCRRELPSSKKRPSTLDPLFFLSSLPSSGIQPCRGSLLSSSYFTHLTQDAPLRRHWRLPGGRRRSLRLSLHPR
jgi:hypothetical protein